MRSFVIEVVANSENEFAKMISVFIPVYNEAEILSASVQDVVNYLRQLGCQYEILMVDNGSTDASLTIAQQLQLLIPELRVYSMPQRGPGLSFSLALREAKGEFFLTLDVDISSGCSFIGDATRLLESADVVIGSKLLGKQHRRMLRVASSRSYLRLTQWLLRLSYSDYSIGYKGFRRSQILPYAPWLDPWTEYILELVTIFSLRKRCIVQIPIQCEDLRTSRFSLLHEGWYRSRHLYRTARLLRDPHSWFHK